MSPATVATRTPVSARISAAVASSVSLIARVDRHLDALARQRPRARLAETLARGADDRALASNAEIHPLFLLQAALRSPGPAAAAGPTGCRRFQEVMGAGRHGGVEQIAVGPVLDGEAERILPVVEDLSAEDVAPDAPVVADAGRGEMIVPDHQVVEVGDLPGDVSELRLARLEQQQGVMIGREIAAVAADEAAERPLRPLEVHVVGDQQPEVAVIPAPEPRRDPPS